MESEYDAQQRGSLLDYARYLAGMDASMRQKVALTAAHLLCEGRVADLGTGSGGASLAFAQLYPRLEVIGVDISETMVELARERHKLPNLSFMVGDAAVTVFPAGSLDGILASSMLHHVTSFNGYDYDAARRALAAQVEQLCEHGVLVVRDFVDPGGGTVLMDLPGTDGADSDDVRACSTAHLFERFAREFRPLSATPGFAFERCEQADASARGPAASFRRYRVSHKLAAEFLLRKDYRDDWESELKEEYTYFSQDEFERIFQALGLRVLTSTPLHNPWIVKQRFEGKVFLYGEDGEPLETPATNYLIVGERVAPHAGVGFRVSEPKPAIGFLRMEHFRDLRTGELRDLVRRPSTTLDVVPWFAERGVLYVLSRTSYPRPILRAEPERARPLDGSLACPWAVEPLSFIQRDRPLGQTIEEALWEYARLDHSQLLRFEPGSDYYPSPGGLAERVESMFVQIAPTFVQHEVGARSGFSSSGRVQAIEAEQLLRAAQVGGLADARLELNVYDLLARQRRSWGPWLGDVLSLAESGAPRTIMEHEALFALPPRRCFAKAEQNPSPFLGLVCREMVEIDARGERVSAQTLEYVMPLHHAAVTASVALLRKHQGVVYIGLDDDDLPAAQCFGGHSNLWVTPAWRLPLHVRRRDQAHAFMRERMQHEYGVSLGSVISLGGKYHPTPGATPEVVHPFAAEVSGEEGAARRLFWTPLRELAVHARRLHAGHLRIAALRAAHALGLDPTLG